MSSPDASAAAGTAKSRARTRMTVDDVRDPARIDVDVWADVVCPWCCIGKRRFEAALPLFGGSTHVAVTYHSFELDPSRPAVIPGSLEEMLAAKYGIPIDDARAMNARVTAIASIEGLDYRLDLARPANSFDAHRLIQAAADAGVGGAMVERLYRAYFSEGESIADHDVLVRLAGDAGLGAGDAIRALDSLDYAARVRADEELAGQLGITGVPFFVVDRRIGVSGAQPTDVFVPALEMARAG